MRGKKNPPLDLTPVPDGTPLTFDGMARAYLEDYHLQRYRTMNTARPRVEHLRSFLGGWSVAMITADAVRRYQLYRRKQGAEAATINRETSALSRMFQLAIRRGLLERMPLFPTRLEENPPRDGFFEHDEYLKVRAHAPASYQDVLDFAYYSGWRRNEILELTWDEGEGGSSNNCALNTTDVGCHVATIVVSPTTTAGSTSATLYNHWSLLRTTEELLKLPLLGQATTAASMRTAFGL